MPPIEKGVDAVTAERSRCIAIVEYSVNNKQMREKIVARIREGHDLHLNSGESEKAKPGGATGLMASPKPSVTHGSPGYLHSVMGDHIREGEPPNDGVPPHYMGLASELDPAIDLGLPYNSPGIYTGELPTNIADWTTAGVRAWGSVHAASDAVARRIMEIVTECGGECDSEASGYIADNLYLLVRTWGLACVLKVKP